MALPTLCIPPHILGASEHLLRRNRRPPNVQGRTRRFFLEIGIGLCRIGTVDRQLVLDVLNDGEAVDYLELVPGWHRRAPNTACNGAQKVTIGWQRLPGQPELENRRREVPRALLVHEGCSRSITVAAFPVAAEASPLIDLFAVGDPFARSWHRGIRNFALLRLKHPPPLAAIPATFPAMRDETLQRFCLGGDVDGFAGIFLVRCPNDRSLAARR